MNKSFEQEKERIEQCIWIFLVAIWALRYWQGLLLHQLNAAPFVSVAADNTFWVWYALQIPRMIEQEAFAIVLDLLWLLIPCFFLYGKRHRLLAVLMSILVLNYFIIYNAVATHHEHTLVAVLLMVILLFIKDKKNFVLSFAALRYYAIFVLFSAGLWKLMRGSLFFPDQMAEILKVQHLDFLIAYPNAYFSKIITYLIQHSWLSSLFWYSGWILELSFFIGFLTRKFDKVLGILFLAFFVMDYLLMHLCFFEICIFALLFYPWKAIWSEYEALKTKSPQSP